VKHDRHAVAFIVLATAFGTVLHAQAPPTAPPGSDAHLQVQVVVSRYQGDKKISSLPYSLTVNPDTRKTSLRMGAEVPVVATPTTAAARGDKPASPTPSYSYKPIGTNIDCSANTAAGNQFRLTLEIEDSSVYPDEQPRTPKGVPMFRSFKLSNTLLLKDGQSTQLTSAVDKVSGEVLKVDVTLTVVK
jgi:Bacterial type II and III secretion system protein